MALPFYQPVDYTRGQQLDTTGLMQGLAGLQQQQQQQQQQERGRQFQQALGGVEGQPLDYGQLMQQFPEQADLLIKMENQQGLRNQLQQTNAGTDAVNLYRALDRGDNEGAAAIISQNANDINSLGDPSFTADSAMQMLQNNPEQLKNAALNIARMSGGQDAFLENIQGQQPVPMTAYQQEMIRGKGVDQELRRLEIQDKQLDREYDRAKTDLEKVKVQQQIDEVNRKKTEALEAKEKGKQEAVTTTQQTLESVNNLLNAEGLEEAVGVQASFPTFAGTEAADFETALDSFVGNLTLENMGKMSGVLSDSDIKMIQNASSGLSIKMSQKTFRERLNTIKKRLEDKLEKQGGTMATPAAGATEGDFSNLWGG